MYMRTAHRRKVSMLVGCEQDPEGGLLGGLLYSSIWAEQPTMREAVEVLS